jgi:hypothetical protein
MYTQAVTIAVNVLSIGLTLGSFALLLNGGALPLGTSFRMTIEPLLRSIRSASSRSRSELADVTVLMAITFAGLATVFENPVGLIMMGLMYWARPFIRRATREEHKLLALASTFSTDLIIGVYVPMVIAQFLLLNVFTGVAMLLVAVALSWPAGGGQSIPGRTWKLAPVTTY